MATYLLSHPLSAPQQVNVKKGWAGAPAPAFSWGCWSGSSSFRDMKIASFAPRVLFEHVLVVGDGHVLGASVSLSTWRVRNLSVNKSSKNATTNT